MIGVSKAFQETFHLPSTFYWVEACMAFVNENECLSCSASLEFKAEVFGVSALRVNILKSKFLTGVPTQTHFRSLPLQ